jgi:hypothetical protein
MESKIIVVKNMMFINNMTHFDHYSDGDQNIGQKKTALNIRSLLSLVVHLKEFGHLDLHEQTF